MSEIQKAVERAVDQHGGLRAAARALGMQAPYLCKLRRGQALDPSDKILRKLGLNRRVLYAPIRSAIRVAAQLKREYK